jgi:hypothetical protein
MTGPKMKADRENWDEDQALNQIALPEPLVKRVEDLMKRKYERRPGNISLGMFISDLIKDSLEREEARSTTPQILEEYAVEKESVFIRDNQRDVVAELTFKDLSDLYCNFDSAKNCVHIGYALSIPSVQRLVFSRREASKR